MEYSSGSEERGWRGAAAGGRSITGVTILFYELSTFSEVGQEESCFEHASCILVRWLESSPVGRGPVFFGLRRFCCPLAGADFDFTSEGHSPEAGEALMSRLERDQMARIQMEWQQAFAALLRAARVYASSGSHRYALSYQDFVHLSSAAIALYQIEEHYPLQPLMEVWPREGWEKDIHEKAVAWAELSVCVPRQAGEINYAALSMQRMKDLQHSALGALSSDTVHDANRDQSSGDTRIDL